MVAIIATSGTSMAYGADLWDETGTASLPPIVIIQPGESLVVSYHMEGIADLNEPHVYEYDVSVRSGSGSPTDIEITYPHNVTPTSDPFIDVGNITITKNASTPMDTVYTIQIKAGPQGLGAVIDAASRTNEVPEFPIIALPVATIIGLAFFLRRRKGE
ncbi:PEF-CTERM sorting domain-containing protein [Methanococcoides seepicolus]|uniref:PEF-CTERM sorting domain-containing protein n=1 Tax=Methanococcoides seepicolus TaxID=2828780 RepID=A0A9E4ZFA7_9EURY|nr:PEF-CTERM sorting domain-containing protein [Methanococcoides seepicolus]MCM1986853.1 PEF-CTERM sorting domain-containing protein [Methanococcoides seepicolus]